MLLVVSPLWFVAAYLVFVCLMPVTVWLHRRFDGLVLVFLAGLAIIVDILRFRYHVPGVEWANMIFVWGFAFQLGYFHGRISGLDSAPRYRDGRIEWDYQSRASPAAGADVHLRRTVRCWSGWCSPACTRARWSACPARRSNMAPPTVCILALTALPGRVRRTAPARRCCGLLGKGKLFARFVGVLTRFALPLFLFHTTGMALSRGGGVDHLRHRVGGDRSDLRWWLMRPVAIIGPLLCTLPVIWLFGRKWRPRRRPRRPHWRTRPGSEQDPAGDVEVKPG